MLIVKSPKISTEEIYHILQKKAKWIESAREKVLSKKGKAIIFEHSPLLYFLGTPYPIHLQIHTKKKVVFRMEEEVCSLKYAIYNELLFQKHIDQFYKKETIEIVLKLVSFWEKKIQVKAQKIAFRKTKRQWGSCSSQNILNFNTMLTKLPLPLIEYVVVHELAHITHKHHQKTFWQLVAKHLPKYQELIVELKHYTL